MQTVFSLNVYEPEQIFVLENFHICIENNSHNVNDKEKGKKNKIKNTVSVTVYIDNRARVAIKLILSLFFVWMDLIKIFYGMDRLRTH